MTDDPIPDGVMILMDVDSAYGLVCDPCYNRGWPPHYDYLCKILRTNETLTEPDILHAIAMYAYPVYAESFLEAPHALLQYYALTAVLSPTNEKSEECELMEEEEDEEEEAEEDEAEEEEAEEEEDEEEEAEALCLCSFRKKARACHITSAGFASRNCQSASVHKKKKGRATR